MADKETILNLIQGLVKDGVLNQVEQDRYMALLDAGNIEEAGKQLYFALEEKLLNTDNEIVAKAVEYAGALRKLADKSKDKELKEIADDLDGGLKTNLDRLDAEVDEINSAYSKMWPTLKEIEEETEKAS